MKIHRQPSLAAVRSLLGSADLPALDLTGDLEHFFGCGSRSDPEGVVGLELHESDALLRSLVVSPSARGRGCGRALVTAAEQHARDEAMQRIFLLTETAERFFASLGYAVAPRESAPAAIRNSREFSTLCPASATFMVKVLRQ